MASSPEAIYQSLRRRRERLQKRLREEELLKRGLCSPSPPNPLSHQGRGGERRGEDTTLAPLSQLGRGAGGEGERRLRFIEVKGRIEGADTVTVTKNEILTALNKPEDFILALVRVPKSEEFTEGDVWKVKAKQGTYNVGDNGCVVRYVREPFQKEPDFGVTSVNYGWQELWAKGTNNVPCIS